MTPIPARAKLAPLCVDLDGTLIRTDLMFECLARLLRQKPWMLLLLPFWAARGRARLKFELARHVHMDPATLPYHAEVIAWLRAEEARGRELVLATAADESLARAVAAHLGIFSRVIATSSGVNLKGRRKLEVLRREVGAEFEYVGDSQADFAVWKESSGAILVNASAGLARRVERHVPIVSRFDTPAPAWREFARALRAHQWAKNLLIYVPLITSHEFVHAALVMRATIVAVLFSCCSSGQYILNDLIDLEADRRHPTKRFRPFAAGTLSIRAGLLMSFALTVGGLGIAFAVSPLLAAFLAAYFAISLAYSMYLKRVMLLDVFVLSGLYTFRIITGTVALGMEFSVWLVSFSMFLFLSLAFSKRTVELRHLRETSGDMIGRGYQPEDFTQVNIFGVCSAFLSAVVFILYLQSDRVRELYRQPELLWLLSPIFLYWVSRTWMLTYRGKMSHDPVLFVLRDPVTYAVGALSGLIMLAATRSWTIAPR